MSRAWLVVVLVALAGAGCAGRDFVRPGPETLSLGRTTEDEVWQRLGAPYQEGAVLKNGEMVKMTTYAFAAAGGVPLVDGVTPARAMGFYFWRGVLVGHEFTSSFRDDHTNFDETRIGAIERGRTSEAEVVALVGQPTGEYAYPMVRGRDQRGLVYLYVHTLSAPYRGQPYQQRLVVTLGPDRRVTDVEYTSAGPR
jgi:hypothetical protein